jgi:hypothetical protein
MGGQKSDAFCCHAETLAPLSFLGSKDLIEIQSFHHPSIYLYRKRLPKGGLAIHRFIRHLTSCFFNELDNSLEKFDGSSVLVIVSSRGLCRLVPTRVNRVCKALHVGQRSAPRLAFAPLTCV